MIHVIYIWSQIMPDVILFQDVLWLEMFLRFHSVLLACEFVILGRSDALRGHHCVGVHEAAVVVLHQESNWQAL